jgi:CDGSH-type Zn-finger protein
MAVVRIRPIKDGPYQVVGGVEMVGADGSVEAVTDDVYLCRCGRSARKPYCDGTHKKVGFEADGWVRPSSRG